MNKRILSFALVLCMVLAMVPAMLLSVTAADAGTTTATSKTYETKFEAVKGSQNVPLEDTSSGSLMFTFKNNWYFVAHKAADWNQEYLMDYGMDTSANAIANGNAASWGGNKTVGSLWHGGAGWNLNWHGSDNGTNWGPAYGLHVSNGHTAAYQYVAERSGTATISLDKVRYLSDAAQAGVGIFVNGKMVWPNNGDYYTDVTKYKAVSSLGGTADNGGIMNATGVASVANVELHAGDKVELVVRASHNDSDSGSVWRSRGISANLTVSFSKAYEVTIFDGTNYTYTDAGVVVLPATPAGYCGWDVDGDGYADYAGGSRVVVGCGLIAPVATPELITTDFYANAPTGGNGWQAGNYFYAGSKAGQFRPFASVNKDNIYIVSGGNLWGWGEMAGGLYGNRYDSGLMQGYKFAVRDDIVKGGTTHATSAATYKVPYAGNVTLRYAYFVGRREVNPTDAANPISYEFAIYVNNEKVWPTASAESKTGAAGNITLTADGWYNYTGTTVHAAGAVKDEDILAVLGNPEINITVNGGDTICFALRNGNATTWMAFMNPTVQYTAVNVPTVNQTTLTTSMMEHLPTYNGGGNFWNAAEAQFSGNWSFIGRSTGNFGEKVLCNQASGNVSSNWWFCPKHGGNVYGGDNSSPSFNGEMDHGYWGTYGAISSVPNWSAGYEYIAEATGTLDVSISNLTFKGSAAAKLAIFVNGMMVWPTAGGSYANTKDWYAITAATADVTADAESTKNLFVKAGDTVDFLVRFSAMYSDRGVLFTPTVSYTQMFTAEDPYFVIANPLPRIIQPDGNELTMPDYAGEGKFLGWDVDGDGNPDYLAGQKVTLTAGMQFKCEPVTAIVPGSTPISKVPTLDNGKVTFYNNWFMGLRDVETKKFTPFNNITTAGSEAFAVMNDGMWGSDNWGGYYIKGGGMGRVAMVGEKMGRANTVANEVRYVAPYNGIATISYDKLNVIRGSEKHIASNYIEMDFAVYVNGMQVFPTEGNWFSVKSNQYYESGTYATLDAKAILNQTGVFPLTLDLTAGDTVSFVTRCGNKSSFMCDVVPNVTYQDVTNAPVINQASVTVKDTFDLNLYTHCNSLYEVEKIGCDVVDDNGYVLRELPMKGEMTRGKSMLYTTTANRELNLVSACFTIEGISVMDITRDFQVRTWVKYTNGVVEHGEPYYASVAAYAAAAAAYFNGEGDGNSSITGDSDSMNTLKWQRVYTALLDYAAAVQKYFGIGGAPANEYLPDGISKLPKIEAEDASNMTELEGARAEVAGATVWLYSQMNIMIALNVNGNAAGWRVLVDTNPNFSSPQYFRMYDMRDEYGTGDGDEELPFTHIMMPLTVSAANYRTKYYFKVVDHEGKDASGVLTYSVESYVARMHAEEPDNTNLLELLDSMLVFCRAVNAVGQGNYYEGLTPDMT